MLDHVLQMLQDRQVASISPTSRRCVEEICRSIDFSQALTIIEFGPGDGAFTEYLLEKMRTDATLIAIETNHDFVHKLPKKLRDRRLEIVHGSAADLAQILQSRDITSADYILSGIPFSFIADDLKDQILHDTASLISPAGKFLVYQSLAAPNGRKSLIASMQRYFRIEATYNLFLNLPPLYVLESRSVLAMVKASVPEEWTREVKASN